MVYAIDLTFFVVPLGETTVLSGAVPDGLGAMMAVTGRTYLVNLMAAFQARAHVEASRRSRRSPSLWMSPSSAAVVMLTRRSRSAAVSQGTDSRVFRP